MKEPLSLIFQRKSKCAIWFM